MKVKITCAIVGILAIGVLSGCNMGMQAQGSSVDEIKKKEASMPPDQQISMIQHSPMPADQKAAKIAEIKAKAGIK